MYVTQAEDNASKGKLRVAVEDFRAALALDPKHLAHNVHLHLGLCKVLVKLGRGKDALSSCGDALDIDEELIDALVQVCCVYPTSISVYAFLLGWSRMLRPKSLRFFHFTLWHRSRVLTGLAFFREVKLNF